jgi:hypothetical protein
MPMGMNFPGLAYGDNVEPGTSGVNYFPAKPEEYAYWGSRGIKTFRVAFRAERLSPLGPGASFDTGYLSLLNNAMDYADVVGGKVILDCHNYGLWAGSSGNILYTLGGLYKGQTVRNWTISEFSQMWQDLVIMFENHPGFGGVDLMNEPASGIDPTLKVWAAYAQRAVNDIGLINPYVPIYVEGHGAKPHGWHGLNPAFPLIDPNKQIRYSAHLYLDWNGSGTDFSWSDNVARGVTYGSGTNSLNSGTPSFVSWLQTHGVTGHIGEFGWPKTDEHTTPPSGNPNWTEAAVTTLDFISSLGPLIERVDYWSGNEAAGRYALSAAPANGIDAPQAGVIKAYA